MNPNPKRRAFKPRRTASPRTPHRPQRGPDLDRHLERHALALDQGRTVSGAYENRQEESRLAVVSACRLDRTTHGCRVRKRKGITVADSLPLPLLLPLPASAQGRIRGVQGTSASIPDIPAAQVRAARASTFFTILFENYTEKPGRGRGLRPSVPVQGNRLRLDT